MREALHYKDGKSDKFWRVETEGAEMVLNWGRTGTAGRYEIKVFDSGEECEREAAKLAAAKARKGYAVMQDFNAARHLYFDTDEYGLHSRYSANFSPMIYIMTAGMKRLLSAATKETTPCVRLKRRFAGSRRHALRTFRAA